VTRAVAALVTTDPDRVVAALEAAGAAIDPRAPGPATGAPYGCLAIVGGSEDRLELVVGDAPSVTSPDRLVHGLRAVGIATVDVERAMAGLRAGVGGPYRRAGPVLDPWLGGRGVMLDPRSGVRLVLLEPTTEGRLAAALARHGERPFAAWVEVAATARRPRAVADARPGVTSAYPTPTRPHERPTALGPAVLVHAAGRWGPFLLGVAAGDASAGPGGTIPT
jgi:hypothetical protein